MRRRDVAAVVGEAWVPRQLASFQQIWAEASRDIPYYRSLVRSGLAPERIESWPDVQRIPILTRHVLQERATEFLRDAGAPQSFTKTAGSTGEPLRIGINQAERDLMRIVKLAEWQSFGYTQSSRLFLIWGHGHLLGTGWRGPDQSREAQADGCVPRLSTRRCLSPRPAVVRGIRGSADPLQAARADRLRVCAGSVRPLYRCLP